MNSDTCVEDNDQTSLEKIQRRYCKVKEQIDNLENELEEIKEIIFQFMKSDIEKNVKFEHYSFKIKVTPTWQYSEEIDTMAAQIKERKKVEIDTGIAVIVKKSHAIIGTKDRSEVKQLFPMYGDKWTNEDEKKLLSDFQNNKSIIEIAGDLQRPAKSIRSKLNNMGADIFSRTISKNQVL